MLSDRIPRNLVLVGASLVQGAAQAATAVCVLTGTGGVGAIVALQAVYGIGLGLVLPAEVGLVPQTVSPARLQQANALQGLSRNMIGVLGPAVGGVVVVASSPGIALAIDAVSFLVCADLLRRIRVAPPRRRRLARLRPRASGGMAGVHLEDVALGLGAAVRDRKPRLRRVDRPRPCSRRRAARRVRGRGR